MPTKKSPRPVSMRVTLVTFKLIVIGREGDERWRVGGLL